MWEWINASLDMILPELLLFCAFWFFVAAIDELVVDGLWLYQRVIKRFSKKRKVITKVTDLPRSAKPGFLAVFVAAWREDKVIGAMLERAVSAWQDKDVRIYVGCYPNDPKTIAIVKRIARKNMMVTLVLNDLHGPTSKAACLNQLWRALRADMQTGPAAKAVILHDAEDYVHSDEPKLFSSLIDDHVTVQIPVLPMPVHGGLWVSGHYCDEFAEAHGKTMVVRDAIGAGVPLAGVGCAIQMAQLERLALEAPPHRDGPFAESSLTEDYELGMRLSAYGRGMMARLRDAQGNIIATRAYFPADLGAAIRQKTRWMTGISLAGWDRLGWTGNWLQKWMYLRDRSAPFAAFILTCGYICIMLLILSAILRWQGFHIALPLSQQASALLIANACLLIWRMLVRMAFVSRSYGILQALVSIPRIIIANMILIQSAQRAVRQYFKYLMGRKLQWDKTEHNAIPVDAC